MEKLLSLNENTQEPTLIAAIKSLKSNEGKVYSKTKKNTIIVEQDLENYKENQNFSLKN